jgi:hypothetical protein
MTSQPHGGNCTLTPNQREQAKIKSKKLLLFQQTHSLQLTPKLPEFIS